MAIQHKDIADPDIHELKGVSIATNGSFAKADNGTTVWAFDEDFIDIDIATLNAIDTFYVVMPHAGTLIKAYSIIDKAIATADTVITLSNGATPITNGVITIPFSGSAGGQINSCTPTSINTFTAGSAIKIDVNGASTGSARCHISFIFLRTA